MGPGGDVLHQRGIGDGARHGAVVQERFPRQAAIERIAPERRIEAEDAALRAGVADRPRRVGAVGQHRHAGRHRRRAAAGRAAGRHVGVPRVAGHPPQVALAVGPVGELRRGRARVHDRAGREQPLDGRRALLRAVVGERLRAHRRDLAGHRVQVLDDDRDAFERPGLGALGVGGLGRPGLVAGAVEEGVGEGVEAVVDRFDAGDHRVHQLDRRQRPGLERRDRLGGGDVVKLVAHRAPPFGHGPRSCAAILAAPSR